MEEGIGFEDILKFVGSWCCGVAVSAVVASAVTGSKLPIKLAAYVGGMMMGSVAGDIVTDKCIEDAKDTMTKVLKAVNEEKFVDAD